MSAVTARIGLSVALLAVLTGCTGTPDPGPSPTVSTPASPSNRSPAPTPSATSAPQPTEGTAPGDDPASTPPELSLEQAEGVTYLVAEQGDSDAIDHAITFTIDDSGCLRADVEGRGHHLFVALHAGYSVTSSGIEGGEGGVVAFGAPATAQQMVGGAAPEDYEAVCGLVDPTLVFAPERLSSG